MKIRKGFISNSSSSSFIFKTKKGNGYIPLNQILTLYPVNSTFSDKEKDEIAIWVWSKLNHGVIEDFGSESKPLLINPAEYLKNSYYYPDNFLKKANDFFIDPEDQYQFIEVELEDSDPGKYMSFDMAYNLVHTINRVFMDSSQVLEQNF